MQIRLGRRRTRNSARRWARASAARPISARAAAACGAGRGCVRRRRPLARRRWARRRAAAAAPAARRRCGRRLPSTAPIVKPPYGVVSAINLDKGELKWQVPHGDTPDDDAQQSGAQGHEHPEDRTERQRRHAGHQDAGRARRSAR